MDVCGTREALDIRAVVMQRSANLMDWELASQIATTLGSFFAALTVLSAFILYRIGQRDDRAATFKAMIAQNTPRIQRLSATLPRNDIAHEIVEAICGSEDGNAVVQDFYRAVMEQDTPSHDSARSFFEDMMLPFSVPVSGSNVDVFRTYVDDIEASCAPFRHTHPGLGVLLVQLSRLFRRTLADTEQMVRNKDVWESVLLASVDHLAARDFEQFNRMVRSIFTVFATAKITEEDRYKLLQVAEVAEAASRAYLSMTPAELNKQSRRERKLFRSLTADIEAPGIQDAAREYLNNLIDEAEMELLNMRLAAIMPADDSGDEDDAASIA